MGCGTGTSHLGTWRTSNVVMYPTAAWRTSDVVMYPTAAWRTSDVVMYPTAAWRTSDVPNCSMALTTRYMVHDTINNTAYTISMVYAWCTINNTVYTISMVYTWYTINNTVGKGRSTQHLNMALHCSQMCSPCHATSPQRRAARCALLCPPPRLWPGPGILTHRQPNITHRPSPIAHRPSPMGPWPLQTAGSVS